MNSLRTFLFYLYFRVMIHSHLHRDQECIKIPSIGQCDFQETFVDLVRSDLSELLQTKCFLLHQLKIRHRSG